MNDACFNSVFIVIIIDVNVDVDTDISMKPTVLNFIWLLLKTLVIQFKVNGRESCRKASYYGKGGVFLLLQIDPVFFIQICLLLIMF